MLARLKREGMLNLEAPSLWIVASGCRYSRTRMILSRHVATFSDCLLYVLGSLSSVL